MEYADFIYPAGRDAIHIWREFPLSTLDFDELLYQPLSKQQFGQLPDDISKQFEFCNKEKSKQHKKPESNGLDIDELADPNILRDDTDDMGQVENARDYESDQVINDDLNLPITDIPMHDDINQSIDDQHDVINEQQLELDGDNVSTIDSIVDDTILPVPDPLFDINDKLENLEDVGEDEEDEDDDIDMNKDKDDNHLSFDTNDENILTQMNNDEIGVGIKPRDWSRRARKTFAFLKGKEENEFSFNELMSSQTKRETVVGVFYELLVFKNSDLVDLEQDEPYGDIKITKTNNFYRHVKVSERLSQRISEIE